MFGKVTIVSAFAALAAAQHAPVGLPSGNAITKPLNEVVPACKPFTIQWTPSTPNTVSLILLRGPSTDARPLQNIVVGIPNSGSYVWTPPATLEADVTRYGIQLIDDVTGQYQYSTQIGISKGAECNGYVASASAASSSPAGYPVNSASASASATKAASSSMAGYPVQSSKAVVSSAMSSMMVTKSSMVIMSTGAPVANSSIIQPTKPITMPSSLISATASASKSPLPQATGAASSFQAAFGLMGAAAAAALML